jgi:hypothetical protein
MTATTENGAQPGSEGVAMTRNNDAELHRLLNEQAEHADATDTAAMLDRLETDVRVLRKSSRRRSRLSQVRGRFRWWWPV